MLEQRIGELDANRSRGEVFWSGHDGGYLGLFCGASSPEVAVPVRPTLSEAPALAVLGRQPSGPVEGIAIRQSQATSCDLFVK